MKIKRSSWHYKIVHFGDFEVYNTNLCKYFWNLMFKLGLISIAILCAILCVGLLLYGYLTSIFVIPITILLLFLGLSIFLPIYIITSLRKKFKKSLKIPNENIIIEYVKAKKRKICPLIEYV